MGYFILWIENLAVSLLLVALLAACVVRLRAKWTRRLLASLAFLLPLLGFLFVTMVDAAIERNHRLGWFWPLAALTLAYAAGGLAICWRALRRAEPAGPAAGASWSRSRLAVALAAVVALAGMTFMNIDASVKQNLAQVRTETVALVLSVGPQRVPDRQNAAMLYQQAFEAVPALEAWPEVFHDAIDATDPDQVEANAGAAPFDFKDPKLDEFLKQHAGLLATILRRCGDARLLFRPRLHQSALRHAASRDPVAAEFVAVPGRRRAARRAQGDVRAALADVSAMYGLSRHAATEPLLVSALVSIALEGTSDDALEAVLRAGPASSEELALVKLDEPVSFQQLIERSMRFEEACALNVFADALEGRFDIVAPELPAADRRAWPVLGAIYRVFLLSDDLAGYKQSLGEFRLNTGHSYAENMKRWKEIEQRMQRDRVGMLTKLLAPSFSAAYQAGVRADARHRTAMVGLALYRYRAAHGQFPDKLDELEPDTIRLVPRDPYDGKPLRYRPTKLGRVVYSIALDEVDNHGQRFNWEKRQGDFPFECVAPPAEK